MPEINSKKVQAKQKKRQQQAQKKKNRPKSSGPPTGQNITWESTLPPKEEKMESWKLYGILLALAVLFLVVLYLFVPDHSTVARQQEEAKAARNRRRNATATQPLKTFEFESALLANTTVLSNYFQQLSGPEYDRMIVVAFEDSTREVGGDPLKVKLFKKWETIARTMPRKKVFKRYEEEELPLVILFDCGNPSDPQAEHLCGQIINNQVPQILIFRPQQKPRALPAEHRSDNQIVKYLYNLMQPAVKYLDEREECEEFVANDEEMNVVLFGDDPSGIFDSVADFHRDFARFGRTRNPANAEAFDADMPAILMWRTFGQNPITFPGNISDSNAVSNFVMNNYLPLFGEFNSLSQKRYMKRQLPLTWVAFDPDEDYVEELISVGSEIAAQFLGKLAFVQLDVKAYPEIAKNLDIQEIHDEDEDEDDDEEGGSPSRVHKFADLPQLIVASNVAHVKEPIDADNMEESLLAAVAAYFDMVNAGRTGPVMDDLVDGVDSGDDEFEEDDDEEDDEDDDEVELESESAGQGTAGQQDQAQDKQEV